MFVTVLDWRMEIDDTLVVEDSDEIREQVAEYVAGERDAFDLSITYPDSFTGQVMAAMTEVPRGETRTYGDIADVLDTAPIAVGQACGRNPVPLVVPCHRIVGASDLGGFSGGEENRLGLKERLLSLESR